MNRQVLGLAVWLAFWLAFFCMGAYASNTVDITNDKAVDPEPFMEYLEDPEGALGIEEVIEASFQPLPDSGANFGYTTSKFWLRFNVRNSTGEDRHLVLKTSVRFMRPLEVYSRTGGGEFRQLLYNDEHSVFGQRPGNSRHIGVEFELDDGEMAEFYIRFGAGGAAAVPIIIDSVAGVAEEQFLASIKVVTYLAVIGTLVLSNLFYFVAIRALAFLLYVLQAIAFVLYTAHMDGFTFQYLWPNLPWLNANASPVLGGLCHVTGLWFSMSFLQTKRYTPNYYRVLFIALMVTIVYTVVSVFATSRITNQVGLLLPIILAAMLIPHAIFVVRKGHLAARFYLAGWFIMLACTCVFAVSMMGLIQPVLAPTDIVKLGVVAEAIVLSMGLADQYRRLNDEKKQAQAELVEQLNARLNEAAERVRLEQDKETALKEVLENSRLLASTSHDIAQPLRSLKLALRNVAETQSPEVVAAVKTTLDDMESVLGEALGGASGAMESVARNVETDVGQLVHEVAQRHHQDAVDKGIFIRQHTANVRALVSTNLLKRCVGNLVSNAVRYTEKGGVLISARKRGSDLLVQVFDTGCGMTPQGLQQMMRELEKGETSPGHGLGLSIVRNICDQSGWLFEVRSTEGRGSAFSIRIPGVVIA